MIYTCHYCESSEYLFIFLIYLQYLSNGLFCVHVYDTYHSEYTSLYQYIMALNGGVIYRRFDLIFELFGFVKSRIEFD